MHCVNKKKWKKWIKEGEVSQAVHKWELVFLVTVPKNKLHTNHSYTGCDMFQFLPDSFCSHFGARLSISVVFYIWLKQEGGLSHKALQTVCVCACTRAEGPLLACLSWRQSQPLDPSELLISSNRSWLDPQDGGGSSAGVLSKQRPLWSRFYPPDPRTQEQTDSGATWGRMYQQGKVFSEFVVKKC